MSFPRLKTLLCLLFCAILCATALGEHPKVSPDHPADSTALPASPEKNADGTAPDASTEEAADSTALPASPANPLDIVPALDAFALAARDFCLEWLGLRGMDIDAFADACRADMEALPDRLDDVLSAAEAQAADGTYALRFLAAHLNDVMNTADPAADLRALLTLFNGQRDAAVDEFSALREKTASLFGSLR